MALRLPPQLRARQRVGGASTIKAPVDDRPSSLAGQEAPQVARLLRPWLVPAMLSYLEVQVLVVPRGST